MAVVRRWSEIHFTSSGGVITSSHVDPRYIIDASTHPELFTEPPKRQGNDRAERRRKAADRSKDRKYREGRTLVPVKRTTPQKPDSPPGDGAA